MGTLLSALGNILWAALLHKASLALENAALHQQLTIYQRAHGRARLRTHDRIFWVLFRQLWSGRYRKLIVVRPQTVIARHRQGFKLLWSRKSGPHIGRRRIFQSHIAFIRRISREHPAKEVWAYDFLTQYTAFYSVAYVLVSMEIDSRRIVHVNVPTSPTLAWVKQQIREATANGRCPRFLVHDNDGIFGQFGKSVNVERDGGKRSSRCHLDRRLDEIVGIKGLPIPYGAPNASPYIERFMRTLRQEALDHFIFLSPDHIRRVVTEYVLYYNGARPSQAIHGIPDPYPGLKQPQLEAGRLIALPILGGIQHDYRLAA